MIKHEDLFSNQQNLATEVAVGRTAQESVRAEAPSQESKLMAKTMAENKQGSDKIQNRSQSTALTLFVI